MNAVGPRRAAALVLATGMLAAVTVLPTSASADGDPASDMLLVQNVFLPVSRSVSASYARILNQTVAAAARAGFPLKVALISGPQDLGAIPQLFGAPQRYAKFLDIELAYNSAPRLLVVMPQGFGVIGAGPLGVLNGIAIGPGGGANSLARAAIEAVAKLAGRAGHPLAPPLAAVGRDGGSGGPGLVAGAAAGLAVVGGAAAAIALRRRRADRSFDSDLRG